ncbi:MAG: hypothetical protein Q9M25_08830 [Mariprofundaceae bacterium]|nr:hypothetical protein [Mariprofundaceae bacterium]
MQVWKFPLFSAVMVLMAIHAPQASGEEKALVPMPLDMIAPTVGNPPAVPLVAERKRNNGPKTATDKIVDKFMALDMDNSAGVSMDEYITMAQQRVMARFAAMDANRDGEVSEDEYRAFWKSRMAKWYRLKR